MKTSFDKKLEEFLDNEDNEGLLPRDAYSYGWEDCKESIIQLFESEDFGGSYGERTSYEIVEFLREKV